jgi:hypothetical protein
MYSTLGDETRRLGAREAQLISEEAVETLGFGNGDAKGQLVTCQAASDSAGHE